MEFAIRRQTSLNKSWNRLFIYCDNGKTKHVDIFDDEIKELQEVINLYIEMTLKAVDEV